MRGVEQKTMPGIDIPTLIFWGDLRRFCKEHTLDLTSIPWVLFINNFFLLCSMGQPQNPNASSKCKISHNKLKIFVVTKKDDLLKFSYIFVRHKIGKDHCVRVLIFCHIFLCEK